ncbi:hypothetical protein EXIGLDRAFT_584615, partial [Exidia glandulosa HHB12029]
PFYGREDTAKLCAWLISHLFSCLPSPTAEDTSPPVPPLANFVAYAIYRADLDACATFAALRLLIRLKRRFPALRAVQAYAGQRLFIAAFIIASKVLYDCVYSNKNWCLIGQEICSLKEINQMERDMCAQLDWELNFHPSELIGFEDRLR